MTSRWAALSGRVRVAPQRTFTLRQAFGFWANPPGWTGRWMSVGPVWIRLGSRSSWQDEDMDAEMIKPVEP